MNRIVKENYPITRLPEDLREMFPGRDYIRLVMEEPIDKGKTVHSNEEMGKPRSLEEIFALRNPPYRSTEDIVAEIRRQRDEWDD